MIIIYPDCGSRNGFLGMVYGVPIFKTKCDCVEKPENVLEPVKKCQETI